LHREIDTKCYLVVLISGMADAIIHGYSFLSANLVSDTQKTGRKRRSYIMWRQLCCYLLAEREREKEEWRKIFAGVWVSARNSHVLANFAKIAHGPSILSTPKRAKRVKLAWKWDGKRPLVAKHRKIANLYARRARYLCEMRLDCDFTSQITTLCVEKFLNISSLWQPWNCGDCANNAAANSIFFAEMESRLWQNTFGTVSKLFHGCQNPIFEQNAKFVSVIVDSKMNAYCCRCIDTSESSNTIKV